MEAVVIPAEVGPATAITVHRRSRRAPYLLFAIASASLVFLLQPWSKNPSSSESITRLSSSLHGLIAVLPIVTSQSKLSAALLSAVPRLGLRQAFETTKPTALFSAKALSAESAELAWEKSENAFHQLSHGRRLEEDRGDEKRENPLERALEGLEGIFHSMGGSDPNNVKEPNLRKDDGRSKSNIKHRKKKERAANNNNRRTAAKMEEPTNQNEGHLLGHKTNSSSVWTTSLLVDNSPLLAALLLAVCGILFLTASFIMRPRGGGGISSNTVILDENEMEIVEFYEKEMECGTMFGVQSIPFLEQDDDEADGGDQNGDDVGQYPQIKRGGSERWLMNSESGRTLSADPLVFLGSNHTAVHRRRASEPLLTAWHRETRESQCDSYYSRVLNTLQYDKEVDNEELQMEVEDDLKDQGCELTPLENVSSLTKEGGMEAKEVATDSLYAPSQPVLSFGEDEQGRCFNSGQSEEGRPAHETVTNPPQSPCSPSSSVSSLTMEGCDIEAPFGRASSYQDDDDKATHGGEDSLALHELNIVQPEPEQVDTTSECLASPTSETPPRSNLYKDRHPSSIKMGAKRVSFSSEVKVCEIPRTPTHQCRQGVISSESYYPYIMLFTVAVAIAVFSLMPAHPSLSPISSGIFERAETMLNSQWDVEL